MEYVGNTKKREKKRKNAALPNVKQRQKQSGRKKTEHRIKNLTR